MLPRCPYAPTCAGCALRRTCSLSTTDTGFEAWEAGGTRAVVYAVVLYLPPCWCRTGTKAPRRPT